MPPGTRSKQPSWRPSPDPEVVDDDGDQEWLVERIVSEEIDVFGKRQLEVRWGEWHREDGTNTTWQSFLDNEKVLGDWEELLGDTRVRLARESHGVDIQDAGLPSHVYHTFEAAQAFKEKMQRSRQTNSCYRDWNIPRASESSIQRSSRSHGRESIPPRSMTALNKRPTPSPSEERQFKRSKATVPNERQVLLRKWLRACKTPIHFYNDVNDEQVPPVDPNFIYLEDSYDLGDLTFEDDELYMAGCDCEGSCESNINACSCQTDISDDEEPTPAYDDRGIFMLDRNVVIECNKLCKCSTTYCRNRVVQRGRDVEIEIFRTRNRGWGARALKDLPKGKFLGLYTGRLIPRTEAATLSDAYRSYTFDLDSLDNWAGVPQDRKYSVAAYSHGNWTRFVNHSCSPNVQVYSVMWDSTPQMNRPYLAFVTNQDIPARTELTIDYDPKSALDKGKRRRLPGSRDCRCGAPNCRGWIQV